MRRSSPALLVGLLLAASSAHAQPVPESIPIGDGHMTVGFELKTTTHGDGPEGRTRAHSLMRYVQPVASYSWSPEAAEVVARWGELSIAERTSFFFEHYAGGHHSTNFEVDTQRYPFLDRSVSWYGHMNIPHIEVRSNPYDSPRAALEAMERLKADVRETIAFHTHLRFPDTVTAEGAEAMTEWLRRTSWAIWLRRAHYSSRTDFVLKAMDNQPINVEELNKALRAFASETPSPQKDIIERRGIRVSRLPREGGGTSIDIEFRGLMTDTKRIGRFMELAGRTFGEGVTGPYAFAPEHPIRSHHSDGQIKFRTFGWHGAGSWEERELRYLESEVAAARERFGISTSLSEADLNAAVRRLATADTDAGKKMLLPSAFNWLFLPLEYDPALPEGVQAQVEQQKAEYLRRLVRLAERVHAGEFGRPGEASYEPLKVATRIRRILHDFVNETYVDGTRRAKLFEWYETSLFKPEEITERTARWRAETGNDRAAEWEARVAARAASGEGEGFGPRRAGTSEARSPFWDRAELDRVFEAVRGAAAERALELSAAASGEAERADLRAGAERAGRSTLTLAEVAEIDARYLAEGNTVRVSTGLLNAIDARAEALPEAERAPFRRKALALVLGHELAHAYGIRAERAADREGLGVVNRAGIAGELSEADVRRTLEAFTREGAPAERSLLERIRDFTRYGTERGRAEALAAAARGEPDRLASYRRADGTLEWRRLTRDGALREGAGLAHFGLALFLKELAVVAQTGDRARIEEFFDGLLTTDFYKQYGLFVLGARAGEVAYVRYLERFVRPRFVGSILKTNVVLAAGLALPQLAEGTFDGRAFAISLGSLGLSSAAVKAGVASIRWVYDLKRARDAGTLARLGLAGGRLARLGGWFYTAAELAVVLYLSDEVAARVNAFLDERAARAALREAGEAVTRARGDPDHDADTLEAAAEGYHAAWTAYRDYLYAPLQQDEVIFAGRLERAAREAKLADDRRAAALERLAEHPALRRSVESRYGSLDGYAEHLVREDEAELARQVELASESYNRAREEHLREVYEEGRRDEPLLDALSAGELGWALRGGRAGAPGDPYGARTDPFAELGRGRVRSRLSDALGDASRNRLQAYDDEAAVVRAALGALGDEAGELGAPLRDLLRRIERTRAMDDALVHGDGLVVDAGAAPGAPEEHEGLLDRVEELGR